MCVVRSNAFKRQFTKAPADVKRSAHKALRLLATNLQHPSLRAKIIDETRRICQARVSQSWRIYFRIEHDAFILLVLRRHK